MDLKSGALYWPAVSPAAAACDPLRQDLRCDVVVIGAGLTGSLIAHALSREGVEVVLVDRRGPAEGSTSASTALVLYEIDTPLVELTERHGRTFAVQSYQRCRAAIEELDRLVRELGQPCGFSRRNSLYLATHARDFEMLRKEHRARRQAGFDVDLLTQPEVKRRFSLSAPGAILSTEAAEVNPVWLAQTAVKQAVSAGVRCCAHTQATKLTVTRGRVHLQTSTGNVVRARWAVMACGFETQNRKARSKVRLKSSYALVTKPVRDFAGWPRHCLIWETQRPYFYLRTTPDRRIMIGGEDEDFADARRRDRLIPKKCRVLRHKLEEMFPQIPVQPAYGWAGTFGETEDGLPYIGPLEPNSPILYALCYGANGTNFALVAADLIRDQILSRRNPHARLFGFDR